MYLVIIDHISLVHPSPGKSLKQEIDEVSKYLLTLRNIAGISPIVIQQANREQGNIERRKQGMSGFTINDFIIVYFEKNKFCLYNIFM